MMKSLLFAALAALSFAGCESSAGCQPSPTEPDTLLCFNSDGAAVVDAKVQYWMTDGPTIVFAEIKTPDKRRAVTGLSCYAGPYTPPAPPPPAPEEPKAPKGKK